MRIVLQSAALAALYFATAKLTLLLAVPPGYATPVWPAAGLALAALMRGGLTLWPAVFVAAAAVNYTVQGSVAAALAIGAGNSLEALTGAMLARRFFGPGSDPFANPGQVFAFFGIALACAVVAASAGIGTLLALEVMPRGLAALNWATWWLGDATGMLIVAPLVLAWTARDTSGSAGRLEVAAFAAALVCALALLYVNWNPGEQSLPLVFIVLPLMAWAALRLGVRGVATGCAGIAVVTVWQASRGGGPFASMDVTRTLLLLQTFLGTLAVTGLALAVAMRALQRTGERLRRAREELEQFVDTAAHDLQEPLRNILSFSDLLQQRYGARLDRDGAEFLGYVVDGATRLRRRIEDLLSVARAGRAPLRAETTDSGAALASALASLRALIDGTNAKVSHDALPQVQADPRMLESLLQNLVGNALKFRRGDQAPLIHVGARRAGERWEFSVRDNGMGIEPRYHALIFEMFERLDRGYGDPSSGVGLAICRRIVERHGGRIWVESTPGDGARFLFTLPGTGDAGTQLGRAGEP